MPITTENCFSQVYCSDEYFHSLVSIYVQYLWSGLLWCLHTCMCCASIYLSYSINYCFILFFINTSIKHRQFKGSSSSRGTDTMTDGPSFPMNQLTQNRGYDSCTRSILVNHELQVNVSEHDYASVESCIFWLRITNCYCKSGLITNF